MFKLLRTTNRVLNVIQVVKEQQLYASIQAATKESLNNLIISCKRKEYNLYRDQIYNKFDEIPLASKGWNHSKSKGDYFIVHPDKDLSDKPIHSFFDIGIHPILLSALHDCDISKATSLQMRAIPAIRNGNHVMLTAETGCGKTIAYLLPIIEKLIGKKTNKMNTPRSVVIIPNRELAYQIGDVAKQLADGVGLKVKVIVGGKTKRLMMNPEYDDIDILVCTPGAIGKLSTVGVYKLNEVEYTVLDEVDTLLDDSFVERMESLIKRVSHSQFILVSATYPKQLPSVLQPIEQILMPITSERLHKPLRTITQRFLRLTKSARPSQLLAIAKQNKDPLLIFTNRNETCKWLSMFLNENNVNCSNISGDMYYALRIEQWNQFKNGKTRVLSATDIGSRGLDTKDVKHVLNYDFPLYAADYIHRIGRTGRLSSPELCKVTNFVVCPEEIKLVQQIEVRYYVPIILNF